MLSHANQDGSQYANTTAATALKWIDLSASRRVMTHFIPRLQDTNVQQRRTACAILGSLGAALYFMMKDGRDGKAKSSSMARALAFHIIHLLHEYDLKAKGINTAGHTDEDL